MKQINLTNITSYTLTSITFRNFMVASNNDVKILANNNVNIECCGYNLIQDTLILAVKNNILPTTTTVTTMSPPPPPM